MLEIFKVLNILGGLEIMLSIFLVAFCIFYFLKYREDAFLIIYSFVPAVAITVILKFLFKIPRPEDALISITGYRFPSGHATMAAVFSVLIIYLSHKYIFGHKNEKRYWELTIIILALAWLILIAYSRVYLNVHNVLDVVVGAAIGIVSTVIGIVIESKLKKVNK